MAFAVKMEEFATPLASLAAVVVAVPFAKVPLAPLPGAVNVTVTPLTALFPASFTVACSGVTNGVLIAALCGVPKVAVMLAAAPARLVNEKLAEVAPLALATTL